MRTPRYPSTELDTWGPGLARGVRLRVGPHSVFIADKHLYHVIRELQDHNVTLRRERDPDGNHRTLADWRNLARVRGVVITALEHQLEAAKNSPASAEDHRKETA